VPFRNLSCLWESLPSGGHCWNGLSSPIGDVKIPWDSDHLSVTRSGLLSFLQTGCKSVHSPPSRYSNVRLADPDVPQFTKGGNVGDCPGCCARYKASLTYMSRHPRYTPAVKSSSQAPSLQAPRSRPPHSEAVSYKTSQRWSFSAANCSDANYQGILEMTMHMNGEPMDRINEICGWREAWVT
jgi:hypothetical protein